MFSHQDRIQCKANPCELLKIRRNWEFRARFRVSWIIAYDTLSCSKLWGAAGFRRARIAAQQRPAMPQVSSSSEAPGKYSSIHDNRRSEKNGLELTQTTSASRLRGMNTTRHSPLWRGRSKSLIMSSTSTSVFGATKICGRRSKWPCITKWGRTIVDIAGTTTEFSTCRAAL